MMLSYPTSITSDMLSQNKEIGFIFRFRKDFKNPDTLRLLFYSLTLLHLEHRVCQHHLVPHRKKYVHITSINKSRD